jgi:predicted ATP-grasp superfamily ATP-dependent carboligase
METIPAVVTPLDDHMGLDIARSLGKRGIPVFGIDALTDNSRPGTYSKYCRFHQSPSPGEKQGQDYLTFLINFGQDQKERPVLFPLSDEVVLLCSQHRASLEKYYRFRMPSHSILENLAKKDGLGTSAEQWGIPAPQTFVVGNPHSIQWIADQITYPAVLKPTESTFWHDPKITELLQTHLISGRAKVVLCETPAQLRAQYEQIAPLDDRLIVQEVIPGEDRDLVYVSFYLNRASKPLGVFSGRKLRIIPTGFGSASYVRSIHAPELIELSLSFLESLGYQGLGGMEFKKDSRDGQYKLIEFNTRFGMWDGLSVRCGVDLPYLAYRDSIEDPLPPQFTYQEGIYWLDWQRDLRAALEYRRAGKLSLGAWFRSLQSPKMWAIYDRDDWRPGVIFTLILVEKLFARLKRSLLA